MLDRGKGHDPEGVPGSGAGSGPAAGNGAGAAPDGGPDTERDAAQEARRAEIAHLLSRLTAPPQASAMPVRGGRHAQRQRPLSPEAPLGLVSALLSEIDATVMARCLVFRAETGARLDLEVGNRRLLHFRSISDPLAEAGHAPPADAPEERGTGWGTGAGPRPPADPVARPLTVVDEGAPGFAGVSDLSRLARAVADLCRAGAVTVEACPPTGIASAEASGVGLPVLRAALAQPDGPGGPDHIAPAPALSDFIAAAGPDARAWRLLTGRCGGDPARALALEPMLEEWCSLGFAPPGETHATVLTPAAPAASPVLFAQTVDDVLALELYRGAEERAIALWLAFLPTV